MEYQQRQEKNRGKLAPPYMANGMIIGAKHPFQIEKMIGGGGFGQIYQAMDLETKLVVAVKVEQKSIDSARLILELQILVQLENCLNTPKVFYSGEIGKMNFIVMQMLGRNIGDLRRSQRTRTFSTSTTSRIGVQCLQCLQQVHNLGYIHRDIKPSNVCIGLGDHKRIIYLVDFGMARKIRDENGKFRPERSYASLRGTIRYISLTAHERKEQGFVDDLWSLFYSLLELVEGLPWKNLQEQDEVCLAKRTFMNTFQSRRMNRTFEMFPATLEKYQRTDVPDYEKLANILRTSCGNFNETQEFEWEQHEDSTDTV